ncbi:MAG: threonine/serine dehydratase [Pseudomonadota bacterium]|nr:threonine/serine dehydratase [Pseudomonadota bacterium]
MNDLLSLADIKTAQSKLPEVIRTTPIVPVSRDAKEIGNETLFLKCENMQVTGAYKVRAAFTAMQTLSDADRVGGIVVASSGNFAQAFAYAGRLMQTPVAVVMLESTSPYKIAQTKGHGGEVIFCGSDAMSRQPTVDRVARDRAMKSIDTWEYPPLMAGHASIGMEILQQCPDVEQVLVPVSSGGVAGGVATAIKLQRPDVRVVGIQPEQANAAFLSVKEGKPVEIDNWDTIADGLSARRPGEFPFRHLQAYLDDIVLVSEREIANAFRTILFRAKQVGEPAGVVAAAGFLSGRVNTKVVTVAVLTGGNVGEDVVQVMLKMGA